MKHSLLLLFSCLAYWAQAQQPSYFQQEAHYNIQVRLNDRNHSLKGQLQLRYVNHSPDTLRELYFHLWPNAYKNNYTAFAQQRLDGGDLSFHFAKKEERGYMDSLDFRVNGQALKWELLEDSIDIARVQLAQPLAPGTEVEISTPFYVKLPKTISRLGHVGQSYQITQWYPKPAVYDREGWHRMPYLDMGEFYSEFGSFDVSITLPRNYVVASTGTLQTPEEWAFLKERIAATQALDWAAIDKKNTTFPPSDSTEKTLRYTAERVHDFAWFADKRFHVLQQKQPLPSGKSVDCFAFFTNAQADLWKRGAEYVARAIDFYSQEVGEYPYPYMSAVESALGAGGGMEYPMVTVLGKMGSASSLDVTIAHEVGHNWFYGILATNERDYPWLDEGFNSYIESKYSEKYYNQKPNMAYLAYLFQAYRGADQPMQTHSNECTDINYYLSAYGKPTLALRYLENYLGADNMREILHAYFQQWQFKHPQPSDVQAVFEAETKEDLDWFFVDLVQTTKRIDYGWAGCKNGVCRIRQKGEIAAPVSIGVYNAQDSLINQYWMLSKGTQKGDVSEMKLPEDAYYRLDYQKNMPEWSRNDNVWRTKGLFRKGIPLRVRLLANFRRPEHPTLCLLPLVGFNRYDGVMVGLAAYNMPLPARNWQVQVMPLFGIHSLAPTGAFQVQRHILPLKSRFMERLSISFGGRSYHTNYNKKYDYFLRYWRLRLHVELELAHRPKSLVRHTLFMEDLLVGEQSPQFDVQPDSTFFVGAPFSERSVHRIGYVYRNDRALTPLAIRTQLEYANYHNFDEIEHYLKLTVEGNFRFMYSSRFGVDMRLFMGGFLFHTDRDFGDFPLQMISRNKNDYFYDNYFIGRNDQGNFWSQQISLTDGGFKTPIPQVSGYASSNIFIFAINLKADIPIRFPIRTKWVKLRPYLDLGYFKNSAPAITVDNIGDELLVNGGLMLDIGDGMAGLYIPLFSDKGLMNWQKGNGNFFRRLSFSLNFNRLNPVEIARKIEF